MSSILVVEPVARYSERISAALTAEGWKVKVVENRGEALHAASQEAPYLVVVAVGTAGRDEPLAAFARRRGGPGVVALVDEGVTEEVGADDYGADELVRKPFTPQELRLAVRRCLAGPMGEASRPSSQEDEQLTSAEIFKEVLAEVEGAGGPPRSRERRQRPDRRSTQEEVERKLEESLAGVLGRGPGGGDRQARRERKDRGSEAEVDRLLEETLSGLELPAPKDRQAAPKEAEPREVPEADGRMVDAEGRVPPPEEGREPPREPAAAAPAAQAPAAETRRIEGIADVVAAVSPREFGQYTLEERIALGGMAEVWKARRRGVEGFQKRVAIKRILPHLTDSEDFVTMFIDEAKLAAQLNHNNIIHIYDLGKIGEDYFIAMEYVEGKDLRTILNAAARQERPVPTGLAVLVAARLASALHYAHRQRDFEDRQLGLVHRDVSPQNVLISYEGDIKLCDFGIVKAVSKASKTQMGALKGKLQYMSPEQARGRTVDKRSDIFSLGVLLFEMLTGRKLFSGETEMSVLEAVQECRVHGPREIDPSLPAELDRIVLKALQREPDARYASAGEMQRELEEVLYTLKPTPGESDLADYMKGLFASEAAAAAERARATTGGRAPTPPVAVPPPAAPAPRPPSPGPEVEAVAPRGRVVPEKEKGGRTALAAAIAAVLVLGGAAFFALERWRSGPGPAAAPPPAAVPTAPGEIPIPEAAAAGEAGGNGLEAGREATPEAGGGEPSPPSGPAGAPSPGPRTPPVAPAAAEEPAVRRPVPEEPVVQRPEGREPPARPQVAQEPPARPRVAEEPARPGADVVPVPEGEGREAGQERGGAGRLPRSLAEEPGEGGPAAATAPAAGPAAAAASPAEARPAAAPTSPPAGREVPPEATTSAAGVPPEPGAVPAEGGALQRGEEAPQGVPEETPQEMLEEAPFQPPAPATPPAAPPEPPSVRTGELVEPGPGVTPPELVSFDRPDYTPVARKLGVEGTVVLALLVDETGRVAEVKLVQRVSQDVGLNEAAVRAARSARFKPATKDGVRVKMWYNLTIPFKI